MDAAGIISHCLDSDVLEAFGSIFMLAVCVFFGEVEGLVDVLSLGGQRLGACWVWPLRGIEDVKWILFHC